MLVKLARGSQSNRTSILRCIAVPATNFSGHSYAKLRKPMTRLMVCRTGTGFTAPSKFLVRKSKKNLGQKKPSSDAAKWTIIENLVVCECAA